MASSVGNRARAAHSTDSSKPEGSRRLRRPVRSLAASALLLFSGLCNAAPLQRAPNAPPEFVAGPMGEAAAGASTPHPIHPASAEKYRSELDWSDSGPDALSFRRIYRSNWANDDSRGVSGLGRVWSHNHHYVLRAGPSANPTSVTIVLPEGYPEITPALRAKVFGLNAAKVYGLAPAEMKRYTARDAIAKRRTAYLENPEPHFRTYGPKTRREFLSVFHPAG